MTSEKRILSFKKELEDNSITDKDIVQEYLCFGIPYVFKDNERKYFKLKKLIADEFSVHPNEVIMIGSAKLGFSLAPNKLWKLLNEESDIDMVIISEKIFDELWFNLYDFNINLTDRTENEEKKYRDFLKYFFKGWIRPDLFPFQYQKRESWFDTFRSISYGEFGEKK